MKIIILAITILVSFSISAQQTVPLYTDSIPNALPCKMQEREYVNEYKILIVEKITVPTLTIYPAPKEKSNGTAVLICPGGGYGIIAAGHEGTDIAKAFNNAGVSAFVLRYRLPNDSCMRDKMFVPLMDAQQAIYLIRKNASAWSVDTSKIGIIGFSAGGHLASTVGTHFQMPVRKELQGINLRPAFMILLYPVISFNDSIAHMGSRENLIGKHANAKWIEYFSNEKQVTPQTPPTFLVHASDDGGVKPANSIIFYEALLQSGVSAETHLYAKGGHGFGLHNKTTTDEWFERCKNWMRANGWVK